MRRFDTLFEPGRIGTLKLRNRIAVPPDGYADVCGRGARPIAVLREYMTFVLERGSCDLQLAGDCVKPCGILHAIHGASAAARAI